MILTRRRFLTTALAPAAASLLPSGNAEAGTEPFPVFKSDIQTVPYKFRRREVEYDTQEPQGTIIVDSRKRHLYFVLGPGHPLRRWRR